MRSLLFALTALVLVPSLSRAAGMDYPDNGAKAVGRAGAFAAKADDGTALYYNPAGLSQQTGLRLLFNANLVAHNISFQRRAPGGGAPANIDYQHFAAPGDPIGAPSTNEAPLYFAPFAALSYDLAPIGVRGLTLAVGVYGPPSVGRYEFEHPKGPTTRTGGSDLGSVLREDTDPAHLDLGAPNRYQLVENDLLIVYPTFAAGYQVTPWLSLGASLQYVFSTIHFEQTAWNYPSAKLRDVLQGGDCPTVQRKQAACAYPNDQPKEHTYWDALATVDVAGDPAVTGIFGALVGPIEGLTLGLSFRPTVSIRGEGTMTTERTPMMDDFELEVIGDKTSLELKLPPVLRAGLRYDLSRLLGPGADVEIDYVFEGWSALEEIVLKPEVTSIARAQFVQDTNGGKPLEMSIPELRIPKHWNDTHAIRVGGDFPVIEQVTTRAGYLYETNASPDEFVSLDMANFERHMVTLGASLHVLRGLDLVLAYGHVFQPTKEITTSQVRQLSTDPAQPGNVVGNGTYETSYDVFALGAELRFGEL